MLYIRRSSFCNSNVNEAIVGGVYWVEKGHMVLEAMGSQASDSIYHGVLACSPVHWAFWCK